MEIINYAYLFELLGLYSTNQGLADHLSGYGMTGGLDGAVIYNTVSIIVTVVTVGLFIIFYYGPFNRVKFSKLGYWLVFLGLNALICGGIAYGYAVNDLPQQFHSPDLNISQNDCAGFGISVAIWAAIFFALLSFAGKWWSNHQAKNPF